MLVNLRDLALLASAGQFDGQGDHHTPPAYVEKAFRKYLECGIFAHGFARARCDGCGQNFLVAFSCKGRGVCPPCNTRRMAEAAAHLCDHVFPRLPVRQWVLSVPKRLRYHLQRDKGALNAALRNFLRVVQQRLVSACPGVANTDPAHLHLGAVAFIHRFGSSLNTHVHFHVCVVDGVFEVLADAQSDAQSVTVPSITFHPAQIDEAAMAQVQAQVQVNVRKRLLRAFVIQSDKYSGELVLTPLELIDRIAQLVPPRRIHRHRYYGVLAPNSPLRAAVTAMAQGVPPASPVPVPLNESGPGIAVVAPPGTPGTQAPTEPPAKPKARLLAHYLWAALIARIYQVLPLLCPLCGGQMRIIAFITFSADIQKILEHMGVEPEAPRITPARGPPLWDDCGAQDMGQCVEALPHWETASQSPPDYSDDQRTAW